MKQLAREYGCMLFGHEDGPGLYCVHCGSRNQWTSMTAPDRLRDVIDKVIIRTFAAMSPAFDRAAASMIELGKRLP